MTHERRATPRGYRPGIEHRIEGPVSAEAVRETRLTPAEAIAGMRIRLPERGNRKLRRVLDRVNNDPQLKAWWHVSNVNAVARMKINDHSWVHIQIVVNIALKLFRQLTKHHIEPSVVRDYGLTNEDAEVVVVLSSLMHCVGMSVHRRGHEDFSLFLSEPKMRELLDGIYDEPERTVIISEVLQVITSHRSDGDCWRSKRQTGASPMRSIPSPQRCGGRNFGSSGCQLAHDFAQCRGEQLELALAGARTAPDQCNPAKAAVRSQRFGIDAGAVENPSLDRHRRGRRSRQGRCRPSGQACGARCPSWPHGRGRSGRLQAAERMVLEAMTVLEQQHPALVDPAGIDHRAARRLAPREGDEQPVVDIGSLSISPQAKGSASSTQSSGRGEALRARPGWSPRAGRASGSAIRGAAAGASPGAGMGRSSGSRPSAARHASGLPSARAMSVAPPPRAAGGPPCGDLLAQRGEADDAAGALDQSDAEQRFELAQAGRQGRLGDEAGFRGAAEMPMLAQRDEILQLLDGREIGAHWQFRSMRRIKRLRQLMPEPLAEDRAIEAVTGWSAVSKAPTKVSSGRA